MSGLQCVVCGGSHTPSPDICDLDGMDRVIAKIGTRKWNQLTRPVGMKKIIAEMKAVAETDANVPDDARLVSGASTDPTLSLGGKL